MRSNFQFSLTFLWIALLALMGHSQEPAKTLEGVVPQKLSAKELAAELQEATDLMQKFANSTSPEQLSQMTRELIAPQEVCEKVFKREVSEKLAGVYLEAWEKGDFIVAGKPGQTVVKLTAVPTEDLIGWTGAAAEHMAGGWKRMRTFVNPGYRIYTIKFLEAGAEFGMSFDGLTKVGGKWYIFPKAWRMAPTE